MAGSENFNLFQYGAKKEWISVEIQNFEFYKLFNMYSSEPHRSLIVTLI